MPVRLTETAINRAIREVSDGTRRDLADAGCAGLRLRLTPAGTATWVLACRDRQGRMRRFPLGSYPDKGVSEARSEARTLHTRVKQDGADPVADRRRERAACDQSFAAKPPRPRPGRLSRGGPTAHRRDACHDPSRDGTQCDGCSTRPREPRRRQWEGGEQGHTARSRIHQGASGLLMQHPVVSSRDAELDTTERT
jgi:hypothetical protein